jgi:hypothetical protein
MRWVIISWSAIDLSMWREITSKCFCAFKCTWNWCCPFFLMLFNLLYNDHLMQQTELLIRFQYHNRFLLFHINEYLWHKLLLFPSFIIFIASHWLEHTISINNRTKIIKKLIVAVHLEHSHWTAPMNILQEDFLIYFDWYKLLMKSSVDFVIKRSLHHFSHFACFFLFCPA